MGQTPSLGELPKTPTGIDGFDTLTRGGLPTGRPTLVCGTAGCGKTLFSMEFLVRGATQFDEPGVFMAFEETASDLARNVASLGFDLAQLETDGKLVVDHVQVDRSEIEATGDYDLEALFIRLGFAIDSIGAKRVVLDTVETLFSALPNAFVVRSELRRLFGWLKQKGVTAVITAERGDGTLTRDGLEEYVSDCVILLDHRVQDQMSTRRMRIVKYRGTSHGTNEYPFLIDQNGFSVLPITSVGLDHDASTERVSTGVSGLDDMLEGRGFFRGSSVLVSGTAGTGKSSLAAHFVHAACTRGERALYLAFEESKAQVLRNMRSIGVDLQPHFDGGLLRFEAARPTAFGLEMHLVLLHKAVLEFEPHAVVIDPITNFVSIGSPLEVRAMLTRVVDLLKSRGVTALFTSLTSGTSSSLEASEVGLSSIIDTWILLRELEQNGERNRAIYVLKSRGMAHSHQVREFAMTPRGIELVDVYLGAEGVLIGSARAAHEAQLRAEALQREQEWERRRLALERKRKLAEAQIAALQAEIAVEEEEIARGRDQERLRVTLGEQDRALLGRKRQSGAEALLQAALTEGLDNGRSREA